MILPYDSEWIKIKSLMSMGIGLAIGLSILFSLNVYQNSNVDYYSKDRRVLKKIDGIFPYTKFEVYDNGMVEMTRTSGFFSGQYRSYIDKEGDGKLDRIYLSGEFFGRGPETESRLFAREDPFGNYEGTLETHLDIFVNSEREFREQLRRFGLPNSGS